MDLPKIEFKETPDEQEANLILFMAEGGTLPITGKLFPQNTVSKKAAVAAAIATLKADAAFKEMGALKDDTLIQVSKGGIKTNYGGSRKRECNFTLLNIKHGTMAEHSTNISAALSANGDYADFIIIDKANAIAYSIMNLEIESGLKVQDKKLTEISFKASADGFADIPVAAVKLFWGIKSVNTVEDGLIK